MNNITIHELRPLQPSQTLLVPVEGEVSPGNYMTGRTNLFENISYVLFDTLSSGFIRDIKSARFTTLHGNSNLWNKASNYFVANSASLVTHDYINSNFVTLSSFLNINTETIVAETINIAGGGNSNSWDSATTFVEENSGVKVVNYTTSKQFTHSDSGKIHHFSTTPNTILSAIIPNSTQDGFNVALMNTGTGSLQIVATNLASTGNIINTQFSGAYVYKDSDVVYAVGNLTI